MPLQDPPPPTPCDGIAASDRAASPLPGLKASPRRDGRVAPWGPKAGHLLRRKAVPRGLLTCGGTSAGLVRAPSQSLRLPVT